MDQNAPTAEVMLAVLEGWVNASTGRTYLLVPGLGQDDLDRLRDRAARPRGGRVAALTGRGQRDFGAHAA